MAAGERVAGRAFIFEGPCAEVEHGEGGGESEDVQGGKLREVHSSRQLVHKSLPEVACRICDLNGDDLIWGKNLGHDIYMRVFGVDIVCGGLLQQGETFWI